MSRQSFGQSQKPKALDRNELKPLYRLADDAHRSLRQMLTNKCARVPIINDVSYAICGLSLQAYNLYLATLAVLKADLPVQALVPVRSYYEATLTAAHLYHRPDRAQQWRANQWDGPPSPSQTITRQEFAVIVDIVFEKIAPTEGLPELQEEVRRSREQLKKGLAVLKLAIDPLYRDLSTYAHPVHEVVEFQFAVNSDRKFSRAVLGPTQAWTNGVFTKSLFYVLICHLFLESLLWLQLFPDELRPDNQEALTWATNAGYRLSEAKLVVDRIALAERAV